MKKINNSKIIMCPKNISSFNLSFICDHVITLRGSIGLEFACQGKYSIIAGIAHYSNLGLSLEPKNKKKYFSFIKNIMSIKKLKEAQSLKAKKVLYYFETKKQHNVLKNSNIFHVSIPKIIIFRDQRKMFSKELIQNYKKITSFENDPYFKDIIKKFKI